MPRQAPLVRWSSWTPMAGRSSGAARDRRRPPPSRRTCGRARHRGLSTHARPDRRPGDEGSPGDPVGASNDQILPAVAAGSTAGWSYGPTSGLAPTVPTCTARGSPAPARSSTRAASRSAPPRGTNSTRRWRGTLGRTCSSSCGRTPGPADSAYLYGGRVGADGTVLDPGGRAMITTNASQRAPTVASDGSVWTLAWEEATASSSIIRVTGVTAAGTVTFATGFRVDDSAAPATDPDVAWTNNYYEVVWSQNGDILDQAYNGNSFFGNPVLISEEPGTTQQRPAIAVAGAVCCGVGGRHQRRLRRVRLVHGCIRPLRVLPDQRDDVRRQLPPRCHRIRHHRRVSRGLAGHGRRHHRFAGAGPPDLQRRRHPARHHRGWRRHPGIRCGR